MMKDSQIIHQLRELYGELLPSKILQMGHLRAVIKVCLNISSASGALML